VPGHGRVTDLATAQSDTRDYLLALRSHMKKAVDDSVDLNPGNASRTYPELERG